MPKHPVKLPRSSVQEAHRKAVATVAPRPPSSGFSSFRYSYTEITASGGKRTAARPEHRFEDGKLTSESFEGELEGDAYDRMVQQTQQYIADQTAQILRSFSWFLSGSSKHSADRD
jgi:hypothetical protein